MMNTLRGKGIELERRLEGEDQRTVHQLGLMLGALLVTMATVHESDELLDTIEFCDGNKED